MNSEEKPLSNNVNPSACRVYATGIRASEAWGNSFLANNAFTKEGEKQTPDTCYYSEGSSNQYAYLDIPVTDVKRVRLLSYGGKLF